MTSFPAVDIVKSLPGLVGIRLEETPRFEHICDLGSIELRRYLPEARARITLQGSRAQATEEGFEALAGYLFGQNAEERTMPMTVPVYQEPHDTDQWTLGFFLSNDMLPDELPGPTDARIEIVRIPERVVACLRYTGRHTEERARDAGERLLRTLRAHSQYLAAGPPYFCQYDAPFTVPFLKRNEAHVILQPGSGFCR